MTEGQIKYQTLQENIRHNLEMERYTQEERDIQREKNAIERYATDIKSKEAAIKQQEADTKSATESRLSSAQKWEDYYKLAKGAEAEAHFITSALKVGSLFGF